MLSDDPTPAGLASALAKLANRIDVLEAELKPLRRLFEGNGRKPLAERLIMCEEWVQGAISGRLMETVRSLEEWVKARRRWEWMIATAVVGALAVAAVALLTARLS